MIEQFSGDYRFLSNFWLVAIKDIEDNTIVYPSVEHFYQAQKTIDMVDRLRFADSNMSAGKAKREGRKVVQRADWQDIRFSVMENGIRQKFAKSNSQLRVWLLETGDEYIQEGNMWGDRTFGVCLKTNEGENRLGKIIMKVREDILNRLM